MEGIYGLESDVLKNYFDGSIGKDATFALVNLGRPKTTGSIELASDNPYDQPLINPNYYAEPEDMTAMIKGKYLHA
jgi:choline dehydrogenase-like flavoprotein